MRRDYARCRRLVGGGLAGFILCFAFASPSLAGEKSKARAGYCASDQDIAALNARVLQTELMVAALSCDEKQRYNNFVSTYRDVLYDRGQALQALFKRAHGSKANTKLNAFITKLANDASQQVRDKGDGYCVFAGELFQETFAASPRDINRVADKDWIASRHGFRPCVSRPVANRQARLARD